MRRPIHIIPVVIVLTLIVTSAARAFFDEIAQLKQELQLWEEVHAADFTDVIEQLDDITGTVFTDVTEEDWFTSYVSSLMDWGVVSGYKDSAGRPTGKFKPGNYVTTAEALKMAMKAADIDETQCDTVAMHASASEHWAASYIACAEEKGVRMFKIPDETSLDRPARRAEVITIILDSFGDDVMPVYSTFNDTRGHIFESDIAHAQLYGIVGGDTNKDGVELGTFRPDDPINRAETAKIVYQRMKEEARKELAL
ncbi:S-layer homology domain-containing protein [Patescibacteria group bacterium]|nr:S-layer homology domain-containing protein [Patescibacteria group bacterium]MBU1123934.1 S-layer homology domain-containing protein [Patescibacteria group bacterium]MBU1911644.1 S-layer homology domain-containing protein [Patescibacteria group bacterium]